MNLIEINNIEDLNYLLVHEYIILNKYNQIDDEIYHAMWCIYWAEDDKRNISSAELINFFKKLLEKQKRSKKPELSITFYLWFDRLASQLRFNFLNGCIEKLPFGCELNYLDKPDEIIQAFLNSQMGEIIEPNINDSSDDSHDDPPYILPVYKICLT